MQRDYQNSRAGRHGAEHFPALLHLSLLLLFLQPLPCLTALARSLSFTSLKIDKGSDISDGMQADGVKGDACQDARGAARDGGRFRHGGTAQGRAR